VLIVVSTKLVILLNQSPDHSVNVTKILLVYLLLSTLIIILVRVALSTLNRISTIENENRQANGSIQSNGNGDEASISPIRRQSRASYVYNNFLSMIGGQRNPDDYSLLPADEQSTEMVETRTIASAPAITITQIPANQYCARPVTNINII
jgi:hypothetical protein